MKFAITGSTGFLGVHLIHHLLNEGHSVIGIKRRSSEMLNFNLSKEYYGFEDEIYKQLQWANINLDDTKALTQKLSDIDHFIHAAALISYNASDFENLKYTNHVLTAKVVDACIAAKVASLIYISSTGAIAKPQAHNINENAEWDSSLSHTKYGYTKYLGEIEIKRAEAAGINTCILNPGIILGYGDWNKGSLKLFKNAYNSFPFYSLGTTGFIGVKDICKIVSFVSQQKVCNERFILISENKNFKEIADLMAVQFNSRKPFIGIKKLLYAVAYGLISIKDSLGIKGMLTKESTKAAVSKHSFDNSKIRAYVPFELQEVEEVIKDCCEAYNKKRPN